jgi:hypothetical protein
MSASGLGRVETQTRSIATEEMFLQIIDSRAGIFWRTYFELA